MADGIVLNSGSGGDTLGADDIGGTKYQIQKLGFGALDSLTLAASGAGNVSAGVARMTLAADDPAVVDLAAIEVLLGTIDADTSALAGAVAGTEVQVDVLTLPAITGTVDLGATDNAVLDAIAASVAAADTDLTTIIGHVDGLETLIGTTNTTLTTIDGRVDGIEGLLGTTNTNTGNSATSLSVMDDWDNGASDGASVSGEVAHDAADAGEPVKIGGYAKAAPPTDVSADGDRVNAWFDLAGRLAIQDGGLTLSVDDGGAALTVDGTVAVTNGGLTELAAAINGSSQMDVNIAASGATVPVSNTGLTELAAAINVSSQMDVNLAASNATVTVTGTVTADLGATDNAVLDAIAASVAAIDTDATTIIGHVDGIEGLLTTIDGDTGSIATSATTIAGAVSGTEMQVDVLTMPTVTVNSHAVTNAGTFAVQVDGSALTALQLIDDTVFTDDAAFTPGTSKGLAAGFMVDSTATDSVDEGDFGVARMTADRAQITVATERSGVSYESDVALAVKYAAIDVAGSGDNTLVASVTGKKIRVLSAFLVSAGTVNVRFESGAGGTALTGQMSLIANTGFVLPHNPHGWFQTADTTLLNLELSAAISVDGSLTYIEAE